MTKREVQTVLRKVPKDRQASVVCSLIGHSRIVSTCFGYVNCGRCDAQIGDSLAGAYTFTDQVIVGHKCEECSKNYAKMGWKDKWMVPDPFKPKVEVLA